jgi:hypothetical protein
VSLSLIFIFGKIMKKDLNGSIQAFERIKNSFFSMDEEQKNKFQSLCKESQFVSKETFALNFANFLNVVEVSQFLNIWIKIGDFFGIDYRRQQKNPDGEFNMETALGKIKLINTEAFIELTFSSLELTKKLLGNDLAFPQKIPPKIFKEMAEDHNAEMESKNEFHLHALIGEAKIKVSDKRFFSKNVFELTTQ